MGYDLHITRREMWSDSDLGDIPLNEWLDYVASNYTLILTSGDHILFTVTASCDNRPGACDANPHPAVATKDIRPCIAYCRGCIETKNRDEHTLRKMIATASALY